MFGVLVVVSASGEVGYLAGFSGMLNQQWVLPDFVPPVFNVAQQSVFLTHGESLLNALSMRISRLTENAARLQAKESLRVLQQQQEQQLLAIRKRNRMNKEHRHLRREQFNNTQGGSQELNELSFQSQRDKRDYRERKIECADRVEHAQQLFQEHYENEIHTLQKKRTRLSKQLHQQVFDGYQMVNGQGQTINIRSLFEGQTPPGGSGDCAAPKLLQYANWHQLKPLALAEFWWGSTSLTAVRHHGQFYPPCRGKCHPLLPFMLSGVDVEESSLAQQGSFSEPEIVYEDDALIVVNKPAGLLSVPGKQQTWSVQSWLQQRYAGALLVHRLDMATSGLLLAAKSARVHKKLQRQFIQRSVKKRYVAILTKPLSQQEMSIYLPLRVDVDDRPRQLVCYDHGKVAETRVMLIKNNKGSSRVHFFPVTGRTHQLRVHAAHAQGLNAPIIGDRLYGTGGERLMLHAESLTFEHPYTGKILQLESKAPF
jgi:tRNA pseudouridine32 synthase/23S rRNA pseudouridine746 synthase